MKKIKRSAIFLLTAFILISCAFPSSTPDINRQIDQIVAATVMALPTNAPQPTYTPYPSPTPFDLKGFFCEYQFCIGHPADISMFDLSAQKNPMTPSKYDQGVIAGVNTSYYIQLTWQLAPGATDPQFMFDLILIAGADTRTGNPDIKLVRGMNVVYTSLTSTLLNTLTGGGAGVWTCGERVFAWKAYTQAAETASALFQDALAKFTCGQN
jgi:hypothetical protein